MGSVTRLLDDVRRGDAGAQQRLFTELYAELDRLARSHLARNAPMTLIDAPALIREVYLRLDPKGTMPGRDRGAFLAYASRMHPPGRDWLMNCYPVERAETLPSLPSTPSFSRTQN